MTFFDDYTGDYAPNIWPEGDLSVLAWIVVIIVVIGLIALTIMDYRNRDNW